MFTGVAPDWENLLDYLLWFCDFLFVLRKLRVYIKNPFPLSCKLQQVRFRVPLISL